MKLYKQQCIIYGTVALYIIANYKLIDRKQRNDAVILHFIASTSLFSYYSVFMAQYVLPHLAVASSYWQYELYGTVHMRFIASSFSIFMATK